MCDDCVTGDLLASFLMAVVIIKKKFSKGTQDELMHPSVLTATEDKVQHVHTRRTCVCVQQGECAHLPFRQIPPGSGASVN